MSTSLLASRMQKVAEEHNIPVEVRAFPQAKMDFIIESENPDMILLGPQVRHIYEKTVENYKDKVKVIMTIDKEDYGAMNGERVLKTALYNYKKVGK